jgi:hypothetical protein
MEALMNIKLCLYTTIMVRAQYRKIARPGKRGCISRLDNTDRYIARIHLNKQYYSCLVFSLDVAEHFIECIVHDRLEEVRDLIREF